LALAVDVPPHQAAEGPRDLGHVLAVAGHIRDDQAGDYGFSRSVGEADQL
jgi:hypothetical protein